jgi:hypothetical protein
LQKFAPHSFFSGFLLTFAAEMIETLLISGLLLAIGMALLLVKVLGKKDGKFSSQHIHDSEAMRQRGIHCVMDQDRELRSQKRLKLDS